MLHQLLRHLKCAFLYIYDGAIFDGSHRSKLDSIWLGSKAPRFDIPTFSSIIVSHTFIRTQLGRIIVKLSPIWCIYNRAIFVVSLLSGIIAVFYFGGHHIESVILNFRNLITYSQSATPKTNVYNFIKIRSLEKCMLQRVNISNDWFFFLNFYSIRKYTKFLLHFIFDWDFLCDLFTRVLLLKPYLHTSSHDVCPVSRYIHNCERSCRNSHAVNLLPFLEILIFVNLCHWYLVLKSGRWARVIDIVTITSSNTTIAYMGWGCSENSMHCVLCGFDT